jgi:hypothetical protein
MAYTFGYVSLLFLVLFFWAYGKWARAARRSSPGEVSPPQRSSHSGYVWWSSYAYWVLLPVVEVLTLLYLVEGAGDPHPLFSVGAILLPVFGPVYLPHWLAWRILGPAGSPELGRLFLSIAYYNNALSGEGALELFSAAYCESWDPRPARASAWTIVALAAKAEAEGDPDRADALLVLLGEVEKPVQVPRRVLIQGIEILAGLPAQRGDWPRVLRRVEPGLGRGVQLLRILARAHMGESVSALSVWLAWLLAPARRENLPFVRSALGRGPRVAPVTGPPQGNRPFPARESGAWLLHLHLLASAAERGRVAASAMDRLAAAWEEPLAEAAQARLVARGLELGVRDPVRVTGALREAMLAELEILAGLVRGSWHPPDEDGLLAEVHRRRVDRLFDDVERAQEGFPEEGGMSRGLASPLEELERWILLRGAAERLEAVAGQDALETAWYDGLRTAACNWPVLLVEHHGEKAAWAAYVMHLWSTKLALRMDDEEISELSGNNAWSVEAQLEQYR